MLEKKLKSLNLNKMNIKRIKKVFIVVACIPLFGNAKNDIIEYETTNCGQFAIELYDELIHSEVDVQTAYEVAKEAWLICLGFY